MPASRLTAGGGEELETEVGGESEFAGDEDEWGKWVRRRDSVAATQDSNWRAVNRRHFRMTSSSFSSLSPSCFVWKSREKEIVGCSWWG